MFPIKSVFEEAILRLPNFAAVLCNRTTTYHYQTRLASVRTRRAGFKLGRVVSVNLPPDHVVPTTAEHGSDSTLKQRPCNIRGRARPS